jgi:hypothetical protein
MAQVGSATRSAPLIFRIGCCRSIRAHSKRHYQDRRSGQAPAPRHRSRPVVFLHHPVGASRHRQDHPGNGHRQPDQVALRDPISCTGGQGGAEGGARGRCAAPQAVPKEDHPVREGCSSNT